MLLWKKNEDSEFLIKPGLFLKSALQEGNIEVLIRSWGPSAHQILISTFQTVLYTQVHPKTSLKELFCDSRL